MGAAERRDRGQAPACGDRLTDPDPLIGARHVVGVLAGGEELAEDLLQQAEVVDLAARDRGQRLVEQHHAFLGPVTVDEAGAEVRERRELQVGVAEAAGHRECLPEAAVLPGAVALEHAGVERDPTALERIGGIAQQRLRPGQPPAHDRGVADDAAVHVCEGARHPHRTDVVATVAVRGVRLLPTCDGGGEVHLYVSTARASPSVASPDGDSASARSKAARAPAASPAHRRGATMSEGLLACGHPRLISPRAMRGRPRRTVAST